MSKKRGNEFEKELYDCFENIKCKKRHLEGEMRSIRVFDIKLQRECTNKLENLFDLYSKIIDTSRKNHILGYFDTSTFNKVKVEIVDKLYQRYMEV